MDWCYLLRGQDQNLMLTLHWFGFICGQEYIMQGGKLGPATQANWPEIQGAL